MVGFIRLPTRTWFLWTLAMLGISHYVWIDDNAREIHIVGPDAFVDALLGASVRAANRNASDEEVASIQSTLKFGSTPNLCEWYCLCFEGLLGFMCLSVSCYCACRARFYGLLTILLGLACVAFGVQLRRQENFTETWAVLSCSWHCLPQSCPRRWRSWYQPHSDVAVDLRAPLCPAPDPEPEPSQGVADLEASGSERDHYSFVVARERWFEVSFQRACDAISKDIVVPTGAIGTILYAMPLCLNLPHLVASRVCTDDILYVCVHNPLAEINLLEIHELVKKGKPNCVAPGCSANARIVGRRTFSRSVESASTWR